VQLKRIIAHDPTGNGCVSTVFLFSHPDIDRAMHLTEAAPDSLKSLTYLSKLLRTYYIVETLAGTLDAFVRVQSYWMSRTAALSTLSVSTAILAFPSQQGNTAVAANSTRKSAKLGRNASSKVA
jgi:hypothetical protein